MADYGDYDKGLAGMKFGLESDVATGAAKAVLHFGDPVFGTVGDDEGAYAADKTTLKFSADFVASNSIAITVNGVAAATVVYATSHAATFAAVVAAIDAIAGVSIPASDAVARTIDIYSADVNIVVTAAVTLGASQATASYQLPSDRYLKGVALRVTKQKTSEALGARFEKTQAVPVMVEGEVYVDVLDAVSSGKKAYITPAGGWTDEVTNNIGTPYEFRSSTTGSGLARLRVIQKSA